MSTVEEGSVLGIDVGFSPNRRSSAVCRFDWNETSVTWKIARFRAAEEERQAAISSIAGSKHLLAAAFDGPLRRELDEIGRYRTAEKMLTLGLGRIGKPGQSSAPVGRSLNRAANLCAEEVLTSCRLKAATHFHAINDKAIVEAFPTTFMGLMIEHPETLVGQRGKRSDAYFVHLSKAGLLNDLITHFLPGRRVLGDFDGITNHDDRAALICALTALCVACGDFGAVGDDDDGWIILPPRDFVCTWALEILSLNAALTGAALPFQQTSRASRVNWKTTCRGRIHQCPQ